jgi:MerR family copper efflux transcriptional regulator
MFSIGQLAKKAKVSNRTLRYYEELGLIVPNSRGENRYRYYDDTHLQRLGTIKTLQVAGFALKEIVQTLTPANNGQTATTDTGLQIAHQIFSALSAQKIKLEERSRDLSQTMGEIDKTLTTLKECFGCKLSHNLESCGSCQTGPLEVRDAAKKHIEEKKNENAHLS